MLKLRGILGGRIARNVYFWLLLLYTRTEYSYTLVQMLFTAALFGLLMVLFYVNNLALVPALQSRKKYAVYFSRYTLLAAVVSAAYIGVLKLMLFYYPAYHPGMVSPLILGGETAEFTFPAFLSEWWPYFISLFIAGCIFAMSWYVMDYQRQQKLIEEARKKHLEMELSFLKNQINPHFLFNSMNNLYALTVKKSDAAPEVVSKISSILRYLLYESDTKLVPFEKEEEIMQAYIDLVLLGLANTANMQFSISTDGSYAIPPLLWLPVLENVFKHGTRFISASYLIDYRFSIENNVLHIYSCNTFKPLPGDQPADAKGIGLANLKQRLKLLFGDEGYSLTNTRDADRYIVDIRINLERI